MKQYIISKFMIAGVISLLMSACNFMDTKPTDFLAPETFYKNESELKMALSGVYYTLVRTEVYGNYYSCMVANSDDLSFTSRNPAGTSSKIIGNDHNSSNGDVYDIWRRLYEGIKNANMLIDNAPRANCNDSIIQNVVGQAKFLRAYYHFLLVQNYYEVPVRNQLIDDIMETQIEATPHREAISWIVSEMESCVDKVDDNQYDLSPSYVKKNTVMGILARVYLWKAGKYCDNDKESYSKAAYWAKKVHDSGKHDLNPDIYALWKNMASDKYDKVFNESIWEAEFIGTRLDGNYTDGRIGNTIGNRQTCTKPDGTGYAYGYYCGTTLLWDLFEEEDARRDLSMAPYIYDKQDNKKVWKKNQIVDRSCGKYRREWETNIPKNKNWTPYNYCILRYADVLLMLAEAENEANGAPTDLAYNCLNKVRSRAGLGPVKGMDYESFQQFIRDERGRELCFESLRKHDLVRWGIYTQRIKEDLYNATQSSKWSANDNASGCKVFCERTSEKHNFLPVPDRELATNRKLMQNKFWK